MDTIFRTAYVYVRNVFAGTLLETDEGYSFSYDQTYLKDAQASAVSLTLPLTDEVYESNVSFFRWIDSRGLAAWCCKPELED